jgi:hypothetical protein
MKKRPCRQAIVEGIPLGLIPGTQYLPDAVPLNMRISWSSNQSLVWLLGTADDMTSNLSESGVNY